MSVGYQDYARLSQQGGTLLYSGSGNLPQNTELFGGYVGAWPYLNMFTLCGTSLDAIRIVLLYFSDQTLTTEVGFRYAVRNNAIFAATQYANMSPWVELYYISASGSTFPFTQFSLYGATAPAKQVGLSSADVPIVSSSASIPAATSNTIYPQHVQPGDAQVIVSTAAASWFINFYYWDYGNNAWTFYAQVNSAWAGKGGSWDMPMIDAPFQVTVHNGDSVAQTINFCWQSR